MSARSTQAVPHHAIPQGQLPENRALGILESPLATGTDSNGQWEAFARHDGDIPLRNDRPGPWHSVTHGVERQTLRRREPCGYPADIEAKAKPAYAPLSRTTDRVLRILLDDDLSRVRAESVADSLGISCTTLRRRLRNDHTSYQFLLDRARQYRCECRLRERWLPGKCLADELGYLEVNSFYRAFRRWTGLSYSDYRQLYH
ncbi:MAG: AraC family transcriptional regulator [Congregibacter sp.]|nr:AraC family transcriptional regulator [Congregibacter sp.]